MGHRPKRDTAKAKELQDLRAENQSLSRQVARLRKTIERLQGSTASDDEESMTPEAAPKADNSLKCGACGSANVLEFATPTKILICCGDCQAKRPAA